MQEGADLAEHINVFNQLVVDVMKSDDEDSAVILCVHCRGLMSTWLLR
jgi:hypothetical protein